MLGNADDMRATADDLDRIDKSLTATYASRSKMSTAKVKALMKEDRLMDAEEAKSLGFADTVTEPVKMAANYSLRLLPKAVAERVRAEAGETGDPDPAPAPSEKPKPAEEPVKENPPAPAQTPPKEPVPAPAAKIVNLDAAKQQGIEEHRAYVSSVTDLCTLASMPERVGAFVRANVPVDQVRKDLLAARAAEPVVMPHHPLLPPQQSTATSWGKITDKINARLKK